MLVILVIGKLSVSMLSSFFSINPCQIMYSQVVQRSAIETHTASTSHFSAPKNLRRHSYSLEPKLQYFQHYPVDITDISYICNDNQCFLKEHCYVDSLCNFYTYITIAFIQIALLSNTTIYRIASKQKHSRV